MQRIRLAINIIISRNMKHLKRLHAKVISKYMYLFSVPMHGLFGGIICLNTAVGILCESTKRKTEKSIFFQTRKKERKRLNGI